MSYFNELDESLNNIVDNKTDADRVIDKVNKLLLKQNRIQQTKNITEALNIIADYKKNK